MHFEPTALFRPNSSARCSFSRYCDWRSVGCQWSSRRFPTHFSGFDIAELRILNLIDRFTHRGAERGAVTFDLTKRIVTASLRASKHSIETLEKLDPICERLGHHLIRCKVGLLQNFCKFDTNLGVPSGPLFRKLGLKNVTHRRGIPGR